MKMNRFPRLFVLFSAVFLAASAQAAATGEQAIAKAEEQFAKGKQDDAIKALTKVAGATPSVEVYLALARLQELNGNADDALASSREGGGRQRLGHPDRQGAGPCRFGPPRLEEWHGQDRSGHGHKGGGGRQERRTRSEPWPPLMPASGMRKQRTPPPTPLSPRAPRTRSPTRARAML